MNHYQYLSKIELQTILDGYQALILKRIDEGWEATILSFLFHNLYGPRDSVMTQMRDAVDRCYRTSLTYFVRRPRSSSQRHKLPIWVILPDFPVWKKSKGALRDVLANDGLHHGGISLTHPSSRGDNLAAHFLNKQHLYVRNGCLRRVHGARIDESPEIAIDYSFKSLKSRRTGLDEILILPRASSELDRSFSKAAKARTLPPFCKVE